MSPELLSGSRVYTEKVDIWSMGVLLYIMLAGERPFAGEVHLHLHLSGPKTLIWVPLLGFAMGETGRRGDSKDHSLSAEIMEDEGPAQPQVPDAGGDMPFDIEAYSSNYTGHTKICRLKFIAERVAGTPMEVEAFRMAVEEIKRVENVHMYNEIMERIGSKISGLAYDGEWAAGVERKAAQRQEKLEAELNGYKTNLIKESIRMGHNDLGDFHYERGDLQAAFKCYVRTRDYCTTSKHIVAMCLNIIKVSIELKNFSHVSNYVQKAEQTPDVSDPVVLAKLRCAAGLAALESRKYKQAARRFMETSFELGGHYSEVIAPQDVATYGGLCALASFERQELRSKVIDNIAFRNFLELVPEVRELINDFYASRYASCLGYLERLKPTLLLDMHLHTHVDTLYEQIRSKALIQYTAPFVSVDMNPMAEAFGTTVAGLEKEIAALIISNQISARIDSHNKILYARHADQRSGTFQRALGAGKEYQEGTRAMLLRASLLQHDVIQRAGAGERERGQGGHHRDHRG